MRTSSPACFLRLSLLVPLASAAINAGCGPQAASTPVADSTIEESAREPLSRQECLETLTTPLANFRANAPRSYPRYASLLWQERTEFAEEEQEDLEERNLLAEIAPGRSWFFRAAMVPNNAISTVNGIDTESIDPLEEWSVHGGDDGVTAIRQVGSNVAMLQVATDRPEPHLLGEHPLLHLYFAGMQPALDRCLHGR